MKLFTQLSVSGIDIVQLPFKWELIMEAYLAENPNLLKLDDGDDVPEIIALEHPLIAKSEAKCGRGRIDMVAFYPDQNIIAIIELKKVKADKRAVRQLAGYFVQKSGLFADLQSGEWKNSFMNQSIDQFKWIGIVCAPEVDVEILNAIDGNGTDHKGIGMPDGQSFELLALELQRFKETSSGKVYIRHELHRKKGKRNWKRVAVGEKTGLFQRRAVLEAIRWYVGQHPDISYAELEKVFPTTIQPTYGVFANVKKIRPTQENQFFLEPDELIKLEDMVIAVCNHWYTQPGKNGNESGFQLFLKAAQAAKIPINYER
jgi:hypothetical protein